jgi:hypothetical protein
VAAVVVASAVGGATCLFRGAEVTVWDQAAAKQRLIRHLRRQGLADKAEAIVAMPTGELCLKNAWAFAIENRMAPLLGGPRYEAMYLVGAVEHAPDRPGRWRDLTVHFDEAITWQARHTPPTTEDEALEVARCYAWLTRHHHPARLRVLQEGELPEAWTKEGQSTDTERLRSIKAQIVAPKVVTHPQPPGQGPIFTVELCTYCPDFWGDIYFWHMEIGPHLFSPSRRPIYLAPRVLE